MSNICLPLSHISQSLCVVRLVGIFGEVLFWTLRVVLGSEDYDFVTHTAWIKFYSRVLDGIVPIVLTHELSQSHAVKEFNVKRMMPIMTSTEMAQKGLVDEESKNIVSQEYH